MPGPQESPSKQEQTGLGAYRLRLRPLHAMHYLPSHVLARPGDEIKRGRARGNAEELRRSVICGAANLVPDADIAQG